MSARTTTPTTGYHYTVHIHDSRAHFGGVLPAYSERFADWRDAYAYARRQTIKNDALRADVIHSRFDGFKFRGVSRFKHGKKVTA